MPLIRRIGNMFFARLLTIIGRSAGQRLGQRHAGVPQVDARAALAAARRPEPHAGDEHCAPSTSASAWSSGRFPTANGQGESKLSVAGDGLRFLSTIVWTALTYNPVRILGHHRPGRRRRGGRRGARPGRRAARAASTRSARPGVFGVFAALVFGVAGVSIFALGAAFNYLVSLFHHRPIRQGLFKQPLLRAPIERHFLPAGLASLVAGVAMSRSKLRPVPARLADRAPLALSVGQRAPDPRRPPARALVAHHVGARRAERRATGGREA